MKPFLGLLGLLGMALILGCTGSGAVSPLTPAKASQQDNSMAAADSDVVYWTSYPVTFNLTDPLNGVCLVNKKLGWACGNNGLVLKWDGETWNKVNTGQAQNENLLAVAFADETEGWLTGTHGVVLHYKNGSWNLDDSQTQETLYGVAVTPGRTVWTVGSNGAILSYNGLSWGKIGTVSSSSDSSVTLTEDLYNISFSSTNNGWAVGNRGTILHFDGQKWQIFAASPTTERLNSVSAISDVQAWIVGAYGTILRFNGTAWNKMGSAFSGFDLYQVLMKSDDDGWAIGQDGTLIYYDGSRWISHPKPNGKPSLNAMAFYKDMGFIVGQNGTIFRYQPNGEMAKFSFLFKGVIDKKPSKAQPYWTLTYTLMNQSPKASPLLTFELPIPKGLQPYQPSPTATSTPVGTTTPGTENPMPSATPTPTVARNPTPASTATTPTLTSRTGSMVSGAWKLNGDQLEWEIGTVSSSEIKTLTVLIQNKKGEKKEYPVLLEAVLKSTDKVIAEAESVTLIAAESKAGATPTQATPSPKDTPPPANSPADSKGSTEGGTPIAQPSSTPGS